MKRRVWDAVTLTFWCICAYLFWGIASGYLFR